MRTTANLPKFIPFVLIGLLLTTPLLGKGSYPGVWSGIYPDSQSDNNAGASGSTCYLCHTPEGNSTWNAYGSAIKTSFDGGNSIAEAIAAVEGLDSDGDPDSWTNLEEIDFDAQPGWTTGMQNYYDGNGNSLGTIPPPSGLIDLDPSTVDTEPSTWGRIKMLYGNGVALNRWDTGTPESAGRDFRSTWNPRLAVRMA